MHLSRGVPKCHMIVVTVLHAFLSSVRRCDSLSQGLTRTSASARMTPLRIVARKQNRVKIINSINDVRLKCTSVGHESFLSTRNRRRAVCNICPSRRAKVNPSPCLTSIYTVSFSSREGQSLESLSNTDKEIYRELSFLAEELRRLDEVYYGGQRPDVKKGDDIDVSEANLIESSVTTSQRPGVSDDEYDAIARREAELCTMYPHLLALLESESGLGKKTTRFGGRVGQSFDEDCSESNTVDVLLMKNSIDETLNKEKPTKASMNQLVERRSRLKHLSNAPMKSLDNAMDDMEAVAWINRVRKLLLADRQWTHFDTTDKMDFPIKILAEPKIDGMSLSLRYALRQNDVISSTCVYDFVWAATRGDGSQGEDVTEVVRSAWMKNDGIVAVGHTSIPSSITISYQSESEDGESSAPPSILEIRGEVVIPTESFEKLSLENFENSGSTFANARNAASGILLRTKKHSSDEESETTRIIQSYLRFYAYDIVASSSKSEALWIGQVLGENVDSMRSALTNFGFAVPKPVIVESVVISPTKELGKSDMPNLLEYHSNLMSNHDKIIASSMSTLEEDMICNPHKHEFPYKIDGVVYKLSSFRDRQVCGSSLRAPRWAIAHKFPPQSAVTRLLNVEIQVGRTGVLTPVAILDPINIGGVIVSRASLHNFHFAKKLLLPHHAALSFPVGVRSDTQNGNSSYVRRGTLVLVSRAGDVIPQITKRIFNDIAENEIDAMKSCDEWVSLEPPMQCPSCGSPTVSDLTSSSLQQSTGKKNKHSTSIDQKTVNEHNDLNALIFDDSNDNHIEAGQVVRCSGPQLLCPPRAVNALAYAFSRVGLDIKGLSKARLKQLIEADIIHFPADLFIQFAPKHDEEIPNIKNMQSRISDLPGWGMQSTRNLANSVQTVASEGVSLSKFICSLGIPFIGSQASQLMASSFKTSNAFLSALDKASTYDVVDCPDTAGFEHRQLMDVESHPFSILTGNKESDKVKGIGPVAISALLSYSKNEVLVKAAKDLAHVLKIHNDESIQLPSHYVSQVSSPFKDMVIVFTGTLPISRNMAQTAVKERGAKATPRTLSKLTSLVVEGEKGGKKAKQAKEMGIHVMGAAEFMQLINA